MSSNPDSRVPRVSNQAAMLCAWFDLAGCDRQDVCDWHDREHLPERLGVAGFRCGRRFVALSGAPEYLIVYDVDALTTLSSPAYLARLNAPTPWTRQSLGRFRNSIRSATSRRYSRGTGQGGFVLSLRLEADDTPRLPDALVVALARIESLPGVVAVKLLECDGDLSAVATEESQRIPGGVTSAAWIVLVEATSADCLAAVQTHHLSSEWLVRNGAASVSIGIYQLQVCCLPLDTNGHQE